VFHLNPQLAPAQSNVPAPYNHLAEGISAVLLLMIRYVDPVGPACRTTFSPFDATFRNHLQQLCIGQSVTHVVDDKHVQVRFAIGLLRDVA
jgi:hypothetical protein